MLRKPAEPSDLHDYAENRLRTSLRFTGLWILLGAAVAAALAPPLFLDPQRQLILLKLFVAAALSLLPGWLYLIFLRRRGPSLYNEYVLSLYSLRLDALGNLPAPPPTTAWYATWLRERELLGDSGVNLYKRRFEEVYGRAAAQHSDAWDRGSRPLERRRLWAAETFAPILVSTMLLAVAWALILAPQLVASPATLESVNLRLLPEVPYRALQYGFIGAYAFLFQDLVRRYYAGDLRSTAYVSTVLRIVFVTLIIATIFAGDDALSGAEAATAFMIGFFPRIGIYVLQANVWRPLARKLQGNQVEYPLSEIEGFDLWHEARFMELGVEDVHHLATVDIVEALLRTRIPLDRLVDWIDQAQLLIVLSTDERTRREASSRLKALGLRGATDVAFAWEAPVENVSRLRTEISGALRMSEVTVGALIDNMRRERIFRLLFAYHEV